MIGRIAFAVRLFVFWLVFFAFSRAVFLAFHLARWQEFEFALVLKTFFYGLKLDVSAAAYLLLIPLVIILLSIFIRPALLCLPLKVYHILMLVLISAINTTDLQLYREWGVKINVQVLEYLKYPKEALASSASSPVSLLLFIFALFVFTGLLMYRYIAMPQRFVCNAGSNLNNRQKALGLAGWAMLAVISFLAMRGGTQLAAINQSAAYFSHHPFLNHAALNTSWNLFYTIDNIGARVDVSRYMYMPAEQAETIVDDLYKLSGNGPGLNVLSENRPNIVVIVLESWTADVIAALGGEEGIAPEFEKLVQDGLLFDSIYANGDRTDKGLLAVISGFPAQPTATIITQPEKFEKLPSLARQMKENAYNSSFYYGGESGFANIKAYMISAGFDKIVDKEAFDEQQMNSKWGAHDHVLFEKVIQGLGNQQNPFFATVLTLSSHEPFEIPIPSKYEGVDEKNKFKSSVFYTDKSLGAFFVKAREQAWYKNTLFVLVADHGHRMPRDYQEIYHPGRFRIPLLFYGEVLKKDYRGKRISKTGGQTDIAATLLAQLGMENNNNTFAWSKNLLNKDAASFAFYAFNDGFGWIAPPARLAFDNVSRQVIWSENLAQPKQDSILLSGKAYMQRLMTTYASY